MMKTKRNIILIVGVLVLTGLLVSIKINSFSISKNKKELAEGRGVIQFQPVVCANEVKSGYNFAERYGTTVTPDGKGNVDIKLNPSNEDKGQFPGIEFYIEQLDTIIVRKNKEGKADIISIDNRTFNVEDSLISEKNSYRLSHDTIANMKKGAVCEGENCRAFDTCEGLKNCEESDTLVVTLKAKKENSDEYCKGTVFFQLEITLDSFKEADIVGATALLIDGIDEKLPDIDISSDSTIDCANPKTEFDKSYCSPLKKQVNGKEVLVTEFPDYSSQLDKSRFSDKTRISLKCDPKNIIQSQSSVNNLNNTENKFYYTEADGMKATKSESKDLGTYVYHYAPGDVEKENIKIDVTCTEQVKVQYGPPVAVRGGMCFEYNVKVTSVVTCTPGKIPAPKTGDQLHYCTPTPSCYHPRSDATLLQGGPGDDFDQCIKDCDGGKYTEKCGLQCYNSIYGKDKKFSGKGKQNIKGVANTNDEQDTLDEQIAACKKAESKSGLGKFRISGYPPGAEGNVEFYGCYFWDDGKIKWSSGNIGAVYKNLNKRDAETYRDTGIAPGRFYNKGYGNKQDWAVVNDGFFRLLKTDGVCDAKCTWIGCSTGNYLNPAQIKIDLDANKKTYQDAKEEAKRISTCQTTTTQFNIEVTEYGKYFKSIDELQSPVSTNIGETASNGYKYISDYSGCYKDVSNSSEKYHTTWGFPGVWVDKAKTQAFSLLDKSADRWRKYPGQFCLPYKANHVNEPYWSYYYTKLFKDQSTSVDSKEYQDKCASCFNWIDESSINLNKDNNNDIKWNIKAYTNNFGHFGWNIDVNCFYAYSDVLGKGGDCTENPPKECSTIDKRIRSVNLNRLFPAANGEDGDRVPGFNWSEYATNIKKDPNYSSVPSAYKKEVEKEGSNLYSNENELDYRIYLSKKDLHEIKEEVRSDNFSYTDYEGTMIFDENSSVGIYKSKLLRDTLNNSGNKLPHEKLLACNNIKNNECAKYGEGDK